MANISKIARDSNGLISSWLEDEYTVTVSRDSSGFPVIIKAQSPFKRTLKAQFVYVNGKLVGISGDFASAMIQIVANEIGISSGGSVGSTIDISDIIGYTGSIFYLNGRKVTVPAGLSQLPDNLLIQGPGEFIFQSDSTTLRMGAGGVINGCLFTGTLTTDVQFKRVAAGVASYFSSPTYQDYAAGSIDGSDFTHTLSGSVMTVGLPSALTTQLGRYVVSSLITLNSAKKYGVYIDEGFVAGDSAAPIQFWVCDANGNELSQYDPSSDTGSFTIIENPAAMKIKVGSARHDHTKLNLTATFDLSKIYIYELTDYLETLTNASTPIENLTQFGCYKDNTEISDCVFQYMKNAVYKIVGGKRNLFVRNKILKSAGGVTTQNGFKNDIRSNNIDLSFKDDTGADVPSGIVIRNHNISLAGTENKPKVIGNVCEGASWAIEHPDSGATGYKTVIKDNEIDCVHTGVSCMIPYSTVSDNNIRISSIGLYGIEIGTTPQIGKINCVGNTVYQDSPAAISYGIAASRYLYESVISKNRLRASISIQVSAPATTVNDQKIEVSHNSLQYFTKGIYAAAGGTRILKNEGLCIGRFANGISQTAAIEVESTFNTVYVRKNTMEGCGSYCVKVTAPQSIEITDNVWQSFTGNYCDFFISGTASYPSYPKIKGNRILNKAGNAFAASGTFHASTQWFMGENYSEAAKAQSLILTVAGVSSSIIDVEDRHGRTLTITDGVTAPSATSGYAKIYTDTADGDLKVIFGDGIIKTIVVDT